MLRNTRFFCSTRLISRSALPVNRQRRINFRFSIVFVFALVSLSHTANALEKVVFQLDWLPGGDKAPIYVGLDQGFFEEAGLSVKIASGRGSSDAITKLSAGRSDIGSVGLGAVLAAKAQQNVPVTAVYSMFTKPPHAFLTTSDQPISSVADLKGKRIATSPFTSSNIYLPLILKENGLSETDVKLIKADPGALGPLLATGRVDAIIEWMTNSPRHEPQLKKMGKELIVIPWSDAGMEIYATSLVASDRFLRERPEVAKRFISAYIKAIEFTQNHNGKAANIVHDYVNEIPIDIAEASIAYFTKLSKNEITLEEGPGRFNAERLLKTWRWVASAQTLDEAGFNPESAVNRNFHPDDF